MPSHAAAPPRLTGHRFLHSPGPTHVPAPVVEAMSRQPMDLGDPRLTELIDACEAGLRSVLQTQAADIFLYASNGHGVWEAVIVNLLGPGRTVLVPGTGHFSESWAIQCEALGARVIRTDWLEGQPIDPAQIEALLRADSQHEIAALFVVHTDTASGVSCDLPALRAALDRSGHPALFVVDVVASLAAAAFAMDSLGVDVAVGASQKGLMVPPGLGFTAVGPRAFAAAEANPTPRFYWDWVRRRSAHGYRKFCGTPPQSLLMGLRAALTLIAQEGLPAIQARHALLAGAVHAAVERWSRAGALDFFCQLPQARSVSVTTVAVQSAYDPERIREIARERFEVAMAGGLGPLTGRVFRIGHLGDLNAAMVLGCLAGVEAALREAAVPIGDGALQAAIARLSSRPADGGQPPA